MTAKKQSQAEPTFEEELTKLEEIAEKMESGDLPLNELMSAYEEGVAVAKSLQTRLERARAKLIEVKAQKDGSVTVSDSAVASQGSLLDGLE